MKRLRPLQHLKNQSGQVTIEAVLILTMLFTGVTVVVNGLRNQDVLARIVQSPWSYLGGMIQNGVWTGREAGVALHPNHLSRHASPQGDAP